MHTVQRSVPFDYAVAICSVWISSGFFLDAWAHGHVPIETFFTPYHGVFYSGMFAMVAVLAIFIGRRRRIPPGYRLALLGIPLFLIAGAGDLLWHVVFGVEEGVDALLSPTHQFLGLAIFLLASGPIRSTLRDRANSTSLRTQLPMVFGLAAWLTLVHFGTAYAFDPAAGRTNAPPVMGSFTPQYLTVLAIGYYKISMGVLVSIFQAAIVAGIAIALTARIRLRFGSLTLLYLIGNAAAAAAFTNDTPLLATTLFQSLAAGLIGDLAIARFDPTPAKEGIFRCFAVAVPMTYVGTYLIATAAYDGLWWDWNVALGAWLWAGVAGFALSLLATANRTA